MEIASENRLLIDTMTITAIPYDPPREAVIREAIVRTPSVPP